MKQSHVYILIALIGLAVVGFLLVRNQPQERPIESFEDCVAAGNPVMESFPRQCSADGQTFVEEIINIELTEPKENQMITSPLTVTGRARGGWYFEGDFPAVIYDANGTELGVHPMQAQGEWMTEDFVPFSGTIAFDRPTTETGTLVLVKDNPSGLPEYADEVRIPIRFDLERATQTVNVFFLGEDSGTTCQAAESTQRYISADTLSVAQAALTQLLAGPTTSEQQRGLSTAIPSGVTVQSISIDNGTAMVDFSSALQSYGGGSCLVQAIRSQIEETLIQFASIDHVEITVDGSTEVLQP